MKNTSSKTCTSFISAAALLFAVPFVAYSSQIVDLHNSLNPWSVESSGVVYDAESDTTTFKYLVTVDGDPDLSHFNIEAPIGCETEVLSGSNQAGKDGSAPGEYQALQWYKWDQPQGDGAKTYSLVLNGNVASDDGWAAVKAGQYFATGMTTVPSCAEPKEPLTEYSISGAVFMDANINSINEEEPGISNVSVELRDAEGNLLSTVQSSEAGAYEFSGLAAGDYSLVIVPENDIVDDFNEILADYFFATTETTITLAGLTEDSVDNDFGFAADTDIIIDDFGTVFQGDGKTIGFWKHQNNVADRGKGRAQVDADTLQGYIDAIEELLLPDPFQFDDANEFKAAYDVMAMRTSDAVELLKKQLLGTEFNDVSGRGLEAPYDELQDKLIALAEHLVANAELFTRAELIDMKDICDLINNTGNN